MRLTRFFRLKESIRQLQAREGINGVAFRLKEEPFRIDPAELVFGYSGIFYLTSTGAITRVVLYDAEQRVDSERMDPLIRSNVVSGGFDNLSLIEKLPRFHFLNCRQLQQAQQSEWRTPPAWQISHRNNSRFIFSYTTNSGVLCDMDTQRLLPCPDCIESMHELGYTKAEISNSGHILSLLDSNEFYTRIQTIRPATCTSVPKMFWLDWAEIAQRHQSGASGCTNGCDITDDHNPLGAHYSHSDINHSSFHYLSSLCHTCHKKKPGHDGLRSNTLAQKNRSLDNT